MGNDGGSIPYRIDLVKTKAKEEKTDEKGLARALWLLCALSKRPLTQPVVSDPLGKIYNKDAIIEYLLDRTSYGDGDQICGYVKGVKDLTNLNVTPNPSYTIVPSGASFVPSTHRDVDAAAHSPFICPLTMKEMIGTLPFGLIRQCGCVFSEGGIKAVISSTSSSSSPKEGEDAQKDKILPCPNCSKPFSPVDGFGSGTGSSWWLPLNPKSDHQKEMLQDLLMARAAVKAAKKEKTSSTGKKRKSEIETTEDVLSAKRAKPISSSNDRTGQISSKVQQELAALEAKRKASGMSDAVKSIYAGKGTGLVSNKNDFFTRTFNRYA